MSAKEKTYTKTLSLTNTRNGFSIPIHITIIITAGFFFWLTEPVFATILTHPYEYILKNRIENTQFAGSVAVILWLIALSNHLKFSNLELNKDPVKLARTLFLLITILALLWLALHARRSELIGMGLVGLLVLREKSSTLHLSFLIGLLLAALIIAEEIRTATLVGVIFNDATSQSSGGSNIASLPGGASNIYMTFANTLHYFDDNDFLLGTTFKNYVLQILPTPLYQSIGISKPNYFYEKIFHNYSYNGGTYIGALFYGNFGVLGMMLFGAFIGIYSRITVKLMYSTHIIIKATGFFLIVLVFRGFWYEFIIILKPLIIVFIPGFLIYESIQSSKLG